jgi:hypothetical protein
MDGMNLNIYKDSTRRSYEAACLYNYIVFELIDRKKARIFYKSDLAEIVSFKTSKIGNKKSGRIERLYIDNKLGQSFLKGYYIYIAEFVQVRLMVNENKLLQTTQLSIASR